jgi:PhoH-like ATPase
MTNPNSIHREYDKVFALDTNIILDNASNLIRLSQNGNNLIVLPETVLDEIDSKKSGFAEINFQAREFGRFLQDAEIISKNVEGSITIIETSVGDCTIYIISKEKYNADSDVTSGSIKNDRKILEIIKEFKAINGFYKTVFISLDVMARTRAISLDIKTEALKPDADKEFNFIKTIHVQEFPEDNDDISSIDKEYSPNNFSYVFNNTEEGYQKLAVIKNKKVHYLDEDELKKQDVNPMNTEQKFFSKAMIDPYYNVVLSDAKAGSGKTLLALSAAMKLVKDKNTEFTRIVYIRNSIESTQQGEDIGYLSGNDEKMAIYNYPLYDTLAFIANKQLKQSKENKKGSNKTEITEELISEKVQELISKYQIETMWTGALRGRTISNAIIVVDEIQNMATASAQLVMSRIDSTCKTIMLGSNRQIDNQYVNKYNNGLAALLNSTFEEHEEVNLFAIELSKVLRGPITAFAEKIFDK